MIYIRTHRKGCGVSFSNSQGGRPIEAIISEVGGPPENQYIELIVGLRQTRRCTIRHSDRDFRVFGKFFVWVGDSGEHYQAEQALVGYKAPNDYGMELIEPERR